MTSCLRELQSSEDIRRITFHARTTTRTVRHELPRQPPRYATEFDHLLKATLAAHPRTLVRDEAQWLSSDLLEAPGAMAGSQGLRPTAPDTAC
ncbi:hypothetical protein [Streptomyces sp. NPDC056255]|uniref:hypothetical protein n=1 Tax=Streptomyces sp. NPDC056255 TaxID=3345764 RepID=UPI0035D88FBA